MSLLGPPHPQKHKPLVLMRFLLMRIFWKMIKLVSSSLFGMGFLLCDYINSLLRKIFLHAFRRHLHAFIALFLFVRKRIMLLWPCVFPIISFYVLFLKNIFVVLLFVCMPQRVICRKAYIFLRKIPRLFLNVF